MKRWFFGAPNLFDHSNKVSIQDNSIPSQIMLTDIKPINIIKHDSPTSIMITPASYFWSGRSSKDSVGYDTAGSWASDDSHSLINRNNQHDSNYKI